MREFCSCYLCWRDIGQCPSTFLICVNCCAGITFLWPAAPISLSLSSATESSAVCLHCYLRWHMCQKTGLFSSDLTILTICLSDVSSLFLLLPGRYRIPHGSSCDLNLKVVSLKTNIQHNTNEGSGRTFDFQISFVYARSGT